MISLGLKKREDNTEKTYHKIRNLLVEHIGEKGDAGYSDDYIKMCFDRDGMIDIVIKNPETELTMLKTLLSVEDREYKVYIS